MSARTVVLRAFARASITATPISRTRISATKLFGSGLSLANRQTIESARLYSTTESSVTDKTDDAATKNEFAAEDRTLYIGNLQFDLPNEEIQMGVEAIGPVESFVRVNRGSARITFKNPEHLQEAVMRINGTFWHGRRIFAAKSRPKEGGRSRVQEAEFEEPSRTLFIGDLPYNATDQELAQTFQPLRPQPALFRLLRWPESGALRGFGYADFVTVEDAMKALDYLKQVRIRNGKLRVNFSKTSDVSAKILDELALRKQTEALQAKSGDEE